MRYVKQNKQSDSYSLLEWKKATELIAQGRNRAQIASKLGLTQRIVRHIIEDFKTNKYNNESISCM